MKKFLFHLIAFIFIFQNVLTPTLKNSLHFLSREYRSDSRFLLIEFLTDLFDLFIKKNYQDINENDLQLLLTKHENTIKKAYIHLSKLMLPQDSESRFEKFMQNMSSSSMINYLQKEVNSWMHNSSSKKLIFNLAASFDKIFNNTNQITKNRVAILQSRCGVGVNTKISSINDRTAKTLSSIKSGDEFFSLESNHDKTFLVDQKKYLAANAFEIELAEESFIVGPLQPFIVQKLGNKKSEWVFAQDLKVNDELLTQNGFSIKIKNIIPKSNEELVELKLWPSEIFTISNHKIITHNS